MLTVLLWLYLAFLLSSAVVVLMAAVACLVWFWRSPEAKTGIINGEVTDGSTQAGEAED